MRYGWHVIIWRAIYCGAAAGWQMFWFVIEHERAHRRAALPVPPRMRNWSDGT